MKPNVEACKEIQQRPRLCVLTTTYPRDELDPCPPFVFELCRRFAADFIVTVIAPDAPSARCGQWQGVEVIRYRYAPLRWQTMASGGGILPNLRRAPWLAIWLPGLVLGQALALWRRRRDFDIIHAHWIVPQGLVAVCCAGNRPVVCTSHGADVFALKGHFWTLVRRFVAGRASSLTAVGDPLAQELKKIAGTTPVHCLPMGVDITERFTPFPEANASSHSLLFVGRLVQKKGLDLLLRALPQLLKRRPYLKLHVVGEGPERQVLDALVTELELEKAVSFLGAIENQHLPARYRAAAVVVLPFRVADDGDTEGLGLTLIEALACGSRVVVGAVAAQDRITQGCEGLWRCESLDGDTLTEAISQALDNDLTPVALRAARQVRLAPYDWSQVAADYSQLLQAQLPR